MVTASALLKRFGSTALSLSSARLWNSFFPRLRLNGTSNSPRRPLCGPHLFSKCGALTYAIRDAEAVTLLRAATLKRVIRRRVAHRPVALSHDVTLFVRPCLESYRPKNIPDPLAARIMYR
jgi:hypothetical protein